MKPNQPALVVLTLAALCATLAPSIMIAAPSVPCAAITRYATVTDPRTLSFAPDGTLYVGRDNTGSGGGPGDLVKIHRIGPGGSPVVEFGGVAIADPDGVVYDAAGTVSGLAGSVIVGSSGKFSRIAPNGTVSLLHSNATFPGNPTKMIFDGPGRMLFADATGLGVMTSATPQLLTASDPLLAVAVDALGRIVASRNAGSSALLLFSSTGTLLNAAFAPAMLASPLARGPGGATWRNDIIAVSPAGQLIRVDTNGVSTVLGTGFSAATDFAFGPDGALYASFFATDEILRFQPLALPVVPGMEVGVYANVTDPQTLSFAPDGTLYTGRDNSGSGGTSADAVKVNRVGPCGSPVTEFGNVTIRDPDAVVFDAAGIVSGLPGSVIVGGLVAGVNGQISRIAPDGTVTNFFGPSSTVQNVVKFTFANPARLLYTDNATAAVMVMTNATPQFFFATPSPYSLALDGLGRVLVSSLATQQVRLYSAAGVLVSNVFVTAQPRSPLARGPGGAWGTNVYFVATNGNLRSVSPTGVVTEHGTGFAPFEDMEFGPDGALYLSDLETDCVLRVTPPGYLPVPSHWWRGDGDATNSTGAEHGTASGGVTYVPGRFGQAFRFDGINGEVSFGTTAGNFGTGDFTVAYWVSTPSSATMYPLSKRPACGHQNFWAVSMSNGGTAMEVDQDLAGNNYLAVFCTNSAADNQWHHFAFVRRSGQLDCYLDGKLSGSNTTNGVAALSNTALLKAGNSPCVGISGIVFYSGLLDEIKIYCSALSASQIAASAGLPDPNLPRLNIARLTGAVRLSWTTNAPGYLLETNATLTLPAGWGVLTSNYSILSTNYAVTNTISGAARFYRLRKP